MYTLFYLVLVGISLLALPLQNTTDYGLKQQKLLPVLEAGPWVEGIGRSLLSEAVREESAPASLLGLKTAVPSLCLHIAPPLQQSASRFPHLIRMPVLLD